MEQLDRTKRYLDRIKLVYSGVYSSSGHDKKLYDDDVLSFFIHCHHIRDWIIHLNTIGITAAQVDAFIDSHEPLKICADLANGSKHCRLTRGTRTKRQPHISGKEYRTTMQYTEDNYSEHMTAKYKISTHMEYHDALELAESCVNLWETYIASIQKNGTGN